MEYSLTRIIELLLEGIFLGFGLSMFFFYWITRIDKARLLPFYNRFVYYSLWVVRVTGLIYFVYFICQIFINHSRIIGFLNGDDSDLFYTIFFTLRSLLIVLLSQLLWYKKIRTHRLKRGLIAIILFISGLFSGYVIERFIIFSNHYNLPSEWQNAESVNINAILAVVIPLFIIERIILFSVIVCICWAIFKNKKLE